jgi:hypothetical protein
VSGENESFEKYEHEFLKNFRSNMSTQLQGQHPVDITPRECCCVSNLPEKRLATNNLHGY